MIWKFQRSYVNKLIDSLLKVYLEAWKGDLPSLKSFCLLKLACVVTKNHQILS